MNRWRQLDEKIGRPAWPWSDRPVAARSAWLVAVFVYYLGRHHANIYQLLPSAFLAYALWLVVWLAVSGWMKHHKATAGGPGKPFH
jgi:hypothetical protein